MAHTFPRSFGEICRLTKITPNVNHIKSCEYHNLKMSKRYIACTSKYFNLVCWKCGKERSKNIFCEHCRIIQKPSETENYFSIFGLKEKFNLDQVQLTNKFRQLQNLVHPDKFSNKWVLLNVECVVICWGFPCCRSYEEKIISEEYSSLLNKAYSYLQTPLKRAEYLLKVNGRAISESETIDEPTFLMDMMTLNEEVCIALIA